MKHFLSLIIAILISTVSYTQDLVLEASDWSIDVQTGIISLPSVEGTIGQFKEIQFLNTTPEDIASYHASLFKNRLVVEETPVDCKLIFLNEKGKAALSAEMSSGFRHGDFIYYNGKKKVVETHDAALYINLLQEQDELQRNLATEQASLKENQALEQQVRDREDHLRELKDDFNAGMEMYSKILAILPALDYTQPYPSERRQSDQKMIQSLMFSDQISRFSTKYRFDLAPKPTITPIIIDNDHPVRKPIIYFYPEQTTDINIQLDFDGELTHTYPKYDHDWNITAQPDGTLTDEAGKEYYSLYWEGESDYQYDLSTGFVVQNHETRSFLEEKLDLLGLNAKERNEFMIYWLPILEKNPYNLIHFSQEEYLQQAALNITPQPETLIRIMMVYQPLEQPINIAPQNLQKVERKGFTIVEWGGKSQPTNKQ